MSNSAHQIMIPSNNKRKRQDNEENRDRLSDLPDCLLIHILSFLNSKYSVQTCVLSTRWKHLWKRVPTLILHSSNFSPVKRFAIFVSQILTLRDTSIALHSLDFVRLGVIETQLLKLILNYVYSNNTHIQQLQIDVSANSIPILRCVSYCQSLTSLKLSDRSMIIDNHNYTKSLFPNSLNLPLLTSLYLANFVFCGGENSCAERFSSFTKLNSLVIRYCDVKDAQILSISNKTLVNLHMGDNWFKFPKIGLFTPSLCTFTFPYSLDQKICGSGLSCVKQVNIGESLLSDSVEHALVLLSWLQDLANVESLKVTSIILQILSLVPDLLEVKLLSLCKLKSLEIKLIPLHVGTLSRLIKNDMLKKAAANSNKEAAKLRKAFKAGLEPPPIPDKIVDFLRQNSPSSEVNISTDYPSSFNLKQIEESIKGTKIIKYHSKFAAPASSSASPASAAESARALAAAPPSASTLPASAAESACAVAAAPPSTFAAPPNLHLCRAKQMVTNIDNSNSTLWPDSVTKAFIEIMVDEVTKGSMSNGMFHARTWTSMTALLNAITNCSYKTEQLKEKMYSLRTMFHEFYSLLQNAGFKWNVETNTVIASEEDWQNYLKTHDGASQFLSKGCDHYKLLEMVLNKNNEVEVLHHASTQDRPNTDKKNEFDNQNFNTGRANDNSYNDIEEVECVKCRGKQRSQVKDHTFRKKSASGQKENTLACGKNVEITSSHVTIDSSLTKCVVALEEIKDISDETFGKALEKFKDPDWREMFMAMSNDRKRGWLFRL